MENKQAVAVAVSVGAMGTALAYLGYSVYNANKDTDNLVAKKSWWETVWKNSNNEESLYNDEEREGDSPKNMKLSAVRKSSAWGKFWQSSHDDMKENNETEASDTN